MTAPHPAAPAGPVPHRASSVLLCGVVPLVVVAAAAGVALSWAPDLPDPVAIHWGPSGVDGFDTLPRLLLGTGAVALVLAAGALVLAVVAGRQASVRRLCAGMATGLSVGLSALVLGVLHAQRGLTDARDVGDVGAAVTAMLVGGLVAGALAAWATPGDRALPADRPVDPDAPRVPLAEHERAAWTRTASGSTVLVAGGAAVLLVAGLAVTMPMPALWLLVVVLAALLGAMSVFRVRVDAAGLTARSALGWPTLRVPLDEVEEARTVTVDPFADFGGWGYRVGAQGRVGVVLRRGEGLEVRRTGGRAMVVTVDDAATAAALLNTLADRSRGATRG
ncbi:DUF1648 domain-containing protein [Cellulomonas telluris]|uniref:DUF1648 domain-containing protein n=1 Tax=Cellulomonas telluris TaxID=2306636 RepID=UPI0010A81DF0|nr:DUF1648 domain-containing protein [Cellulomonas telluris]